jgi:probable F420-dependent oxidoreductase
MQHGLFSFPTDYSIDPAALARLAEDAGFDSLFFPDHTHIPASRETPFPGGEPLGHEYSHNLELFVALTAAASATTRLLVGTGICLLAQRDPITCAKEVATIDFLSGGRFIFGIGGGWNREEMANHGGDPDTRWALLHDRVEAMKAIWTQDEATYHGRFVDFDAIWSWPKPVQRPYPPILLAGNGPRVLDRVLAYADGWAPLPFPGLLARIAELHSRAEAGGRDVSVSVYGLGAPPDPADIVMYAEAGVDRCVYHLPPLGPEEAERSIEAIRNVIEEVER